MPRLVLATFLSLLALAAAVPAGRAARRARQCPATKVWCPDTLRPGEEVSFRAEVTGGGATFRPAYDWRVSAGTLAGGQGTASIKVDTTGFAGRELSATVEVAGVSPACESKASCSIAVLLPAIGCGFDEYGDIKFDDEKARLDNFAIELQNDPAARGYLTCYGGRSGYEGEAARRCRRAKKYLTGVRDIEPERVVLVDGGFRETLSVRLTVVPAGAQPPTPTPTVAADEAVIIKDKPRRNRDQH